MDGPCIMNLKITISLFFFFFICGLKASKNNGNGGSIFEEPQLKRSDFPPGFIFGTGTSAYQVEGAYLEDGKSLNNWDVLCHTIGCGENGENGDVADDHYHMFLGDIELLHSLGVQAYRFSISWARVLPRGRFGTVNPAGIMFYNNIIDNLILKGIEPFVTIHHIDFPQELEDVYGSWLSPEMQEEYLYLAEICFKSFGDRVKYWITVNELEFVVEYGYKLGIIPPHRCSEPFGNCHDGNSDVEPIIVMHNMLLAHGKACKLYHENFQPKQGGSIGISIQGYMFEPLTNSELDREAAKRAFAFRSGWVLDPSIFGEYPNEIKEYLGSKLPSFSLEEKNFMKNSIDFIGINHYSTNYTKDCTNSSCSITSKRAISGYLEIVAERDGVLIGEPTGADGLYIVPRGMEEIVNLMKIRYNNKPMFITENGYATLEVRGENVDELINDVKRIDYHTKYLASLAKSIREGADVRGYFSWAFLDNYEWGKGYKLRFGFYYVDRKTLTRTPKLSARWYRSFIANNSDLVDTKAPRDKFNTI